MWSYSDYSGNDASVSLPLLISERTQQLVLAALQNMDSRSAWDVADDAGWDDIEADLALVYEQITTVANVDVDTVPVGATMMYFGTVASIPEKWLRCFGQFLLADDYPDLADVIDPTFKDVNGDIVLPDMNTRFPLGTGAGAVGVLGGESDHILTIDEMPAHAHTQRVHNNQAGGGTIHLERISKNTAVVVNAGTLTASTGGGAAHNNMPPYITAHFIMKVLP